MFYTVGNLGSYSGAFVIMMLGFIHFFSGTKSKTMKIFGQKFSNEEGLTVRIARVNGLNTNRRAIKVI